MLGLGSAAIGSGGIGSGDDDDNFAFGLGPRDALFSFAASPRHVSAASEEKGDDYDFGGTGSSNGGFSSSQASVMRSPLAALPLPGRIGLGAASPLGFASPLGWGGGRGRKGGFGAGNAGATKDGSGGGGEEDEENSNSSNNSNSNNSKSKSGTKSGSRSRAPKSAPRPAMVAAARAREARVLRSRSGYAVRRNAARAAGAPVTLGAADARGTGTGNDGDGDGDDVEESNSARAMSKLAEKAGSAIVAVLARVVAWLLSALRFGVGDGSGEVGEVARGMPLTFAVGAVLAAVAGLPGAVVGSLLVLRPATISGGFVNKGSSGGGIVSGNDNGASWFSTRRSYADEADALVGRPGSASFRETSDAATAAAALLARAVEGEDATGVATASAAVGVTNSLAALVLALEDYCSGVLRCCPPQGLGDAATAEAVAAAAAAAARAEEAGIVGGAGGITNGDASALAGSDGAWVPGALLLLWEVDAALRVAASCCSVLCGGVDAAASALGEALVEEVVFGREDLHVQQ